MAGMVRSSRQSDCHADDRADALAHLLPGEVIVVPCIGVQFKCIGVRYEIDQMWGKRVRIETLRPADDPAPRCDSSRSTRPCRVGLILTGTRAGPPGHLTAPLSWMDAGGRQQESDSILEPPDIWRD
jgi:hypothetical protein